MRLFISALTLARTTVLNPQSRFPATRGVKVIECGYRETTLPICYGYKILVCMIIGTLVTIIIPVVVSLLVVCLTAIAIGFLVR